MAHEENSEQEKAKKTWWIYVDITAIIVILVLLGVGWVVKHEYDKARQKEMQEIQQAKEAQEAKALENAMKEAKCEAKYEKERLAWQEQMKKQEEERKEKEAKREEERKEKEAKREEERKERKGKEAKREEERKEKEARYEEERKEKEARYEEKEAKREEERKEKEARYEEERKGQKEAEANMWKVEANRWKSIEQQQGQLKARLAEKARLVEEAKLAMETKVPVKMSVYNLKDGRKIRVKLAVEQGYNIIIKTEKNEMVTIKKSDIEEIEHE